MDIKDCKSSVHVHHDHDRRPERPARKTNETVKRKTKRETEKKYSTIEIEAQQEEESGNEEFNKCKKRSPFSNEETKMSRRIFDSMKEANAISCWGTFKEEICGQLLGDYFVPTPFIETSEAFDLNCVYYKPNRIAEKIGIKTTNFYFLDKLPLMIDKKNSSSVQIDDYTVPSINIKDKTIDQNFFFRVADVKGSKMKSCEIHVKGGAYQALNTDLVSNAFYFDLKGQRLETMKRCYIITEVITATEVSIHHLVQPLISIQNWFNVVVAFRYKKFEVDQNGKIIQQMKTKLQKKVKARNVLWHDKPDPTVTVFNPNIKQTGKK